ncbi:PIN-like domain-containing protein [Amycolatopsis methanolica]|uniref:PIN-like domain-containing protein n=1 Tax=Amycolatopsis methanolica TaxID=1814 RepID=UPI00341D6C61
MWAPHQVLHEFWRNRLNVLASRDIAANQALNALAKQRRARKLRCRSGQKLQPSTVRHTNC